LRDEYEKQIESRLERGEFDDAKAVIAGIMAL
jgi:hypothetical protein